VPRVVPAATIRDSRASRNSINDPATRYVFSAGDSSPIPPEE
jgi:hypothetical protein